MGLNFWIFINLKEDLFRDKIFFDWLEGYYYFYLFLDSFDEGFLNVKFLVIGLVDEFKKFKYWSYINCFYFCLICWILVFLFILEEVLKVFWEESNFVIYELVLFCCIDVINVVEVEGFFFDDFLKVIN